MRINNKYFQTAVRLYNSRQATIGLIAIAGPIAAIAIVWQGLEFNLSVTDYRLAKDICDTRGGGSPGISCPITDKDIETVNKNAASPVILKEDLLARYTLGKEIVSPAESTPRICIRIVGETYFGIKHSTSIGCVPLTTFGSERRLEM